MTGLAGFLALVILLVGLDLAAWVFGVDSRDPCDRDPFGPDTSRRLPP
jgi:hypothetical protein